MFLRNFLLNTLESQTRKRQAARLLHLLLTRHMPTFDQVLHSDSLFLFIVSEQVCGAAVDETRRE